MEKNSDLSPSSEKPLTLVKISAHRLKWIWKTEGTTFRKPDKTTKMRNWVKKIYKFNGATVVLNTKTLEIWLKSRPYKDSTRMIYANWNKADLIAREFSKFAQIAIKPIISEHPADCQTAHLVLETKELNKFLKPEAEKETSQQIGLVFDKSHEDKPEFTGPYSIEGSQGADWIFLQLPKEWIELKQAIAILRAENAQLAEAITMIIDNQRMKK